uniref:Tuftelin 1a n=1 Tax=Amphilophus citrinellus TaxID=61819 RepID=A0A3Q0R3L1_AMPCI
MVHIFLMPDVLSFLGEVLSEDSERADGSQAEQQHQQDKKIISEFNSSLSRCFCYLRLDHVGDNQEESARLREVTRRLYAQLKEMEKRHQEEIDRMQYQAHLAEQTEWLQKAEKQSKERGQQVEELQRLLGNMEIENGNLKDKMAAGEAELLQLKADREEGEKEQRCAELEKEVTVLKEKIHHLDDMLMSQQRKVRHMIEQLQNSRTVLQERDRAIRDLEEKVAFLEAEVRNLKKNANKLITCSLPFIKVIEIKS